MNFLVRLKKDALRGSKEAKIRNMVVRHLNYELKNTFNILTTKLDQGRNLSGEQCFTSIRSMLFNNRKRSNNIFTRVENQLLQNRSDPLPVLEIINYTKRELRAVLKGLAETIDEGRVFTAKQCIKKLRSIILGDTDKALQNINKQYSFQTERKNIEELRDIMQSFERDAENLYRYGKPSSAGLVFKTLSRIDQKRLVCLCLALGTSNQKNVAQYFLKKTSLRLIKGSEILSQLPCSDKAELEQYITEITDNTKNVLNDEDIYAIGNVLFEACNKIGRLKTEIAYWVFIQESEKANTKWLINEPVSASSVHIHYDHGKKRRYEIYQSIREAHWAIHIHNHPVLFSPTELLHASAEDCAIVRFWKQARSELAHKMRFFIVQGPKIVEYNEGSYCMKRWT